MSNNIHNLKVGQTVWVASPYHLPIDSNDCVETSIEWIGKKYFRVIGLDAYKFSLITKCCTSNFPFLIVYEDINVRNEEVEREKLVRFIRSRMVMIMGDKKLSLDQLRQITKIIEP